MGQKIRMFIISAEAKLNAGAKKRRALYYTLKWRLAFIVYIHVLKLKSSRGCGTLCWVAE